MTFLHRAFTLGDVTFLRVMWLKPGACMLMLVNVSTILCTRSILRKIMQVICRLYWDQLNYFCHTADSHIFVQAYAPCLASRGSQEKGLKPHGYPWDACIFLCIACHSAQNPKGDMQGKYNARMELTKSRIWLWFVICDPILVDCSCRTPCRSPPSIRISRLHQKIRSP